MLFSATDFNLDFQAIGGRNFLRRLQVENIVIVDYIGHPLSNKISIGFVRQLINR